MSTPRAVLLLLGALAAPSCIPDESTGLAAKRESAARAAPTAAALDDPARPVFWSGTALRDGPRTGEVPECADPCDRFDLTVSLPSGVWNQKPGGLQVALRWNGFGNNLKLYVYHEGQRVAASDGIIATAQSVLIPTPRNGLYQVYVAYDFGMPLDFGYEPTAEIPYEALAEVEYTPRPEPDRALLPDMAARPQRNVTFDTPPAIFFEPGAPQSSCFPSEIAEEGAELCLRFDQVLANTGEGPLEFRFLLPAAGSADTEGPITQRIYRSDGSVTERPGGSWEFHPEHQHYHYTGFAMSRLWTVDESGRPGKAPVRVRRLQPGTSRTPARSGRKVSFCVVDIEIDAWGRKGDAPRTYNAPACLEPTPAGYLLQGLSAGWADVYDWFLPDQYIDVSGLPDGTYLLDTLVDPDDTILETDETNNCGAVFVELSGLAGATPRARIIGPAPACGG